VRGMSRLYDNFLVILAFLRANKKNLLLLFLSLTFTTGTVSASILFIHSYRDYFFHRIITNEADDNPDFNFSLTFSLDSFYSGINSFSELVTPNKLTPWFYNYTNQNFRTNITTKMYSHFIIPAKSQVNNNSIEITLLTVNQRLISDLLDITNYNNNTINPLNNTYLVYEENHLMFHPELVPLINQEQITFSKDSIAYSENNYTVDIDAKISWNHDSQVQAQAFNQFVGGDSIVIILPESTYLDYLEKINYSTTDYLVTLQTFIHYNLSLLDYFHTKTCLPNFNEYVITLSENLFDFYSDHRSWFFQEDFLETITHSRQRVQLISLIVIVITLPTIIISFLVINYCYSFLMDEHRSFLKKMRLKGAKKGQFFSILAVEFLLVTIGSIITGLLLAIPFINLIIKGLKYFSLPLEEIHFSSIAVTLYFILFGILFVFSLLVFLLMLFTGNFFKMKDINQSEVGKVKNEDVLKLIKMNISFILIFIGVIFLLVVFSILQRSSISSVLVFSLKALGYFILITGITLLILRLLPKILSGFFSNYWKSKGNILSLSFYLFTKKQKRTFQGLLIAILSFSSFFVSLVMPMIITSFGEEYSTFSVGAEAQINFSEESNITAIIANLPEEISYTKVSEIKITNTKYHETILLTIINPKEFLEITNLQPRYISSSLQENINNLSNNGTAITSQKTINKRQWDSYHKYSIDFLREEETIQFSLLVIDSYGAWPLLKEEQDRSFGIHLLISNTTAKVFTDAKNELKKDRLLLKTTNNKIHFYEDYLRNELLTSNEQLITTSDIYEEFLQEPLWLTSINVFTINLFTSMILLLFIIGLLNINTAYSEKNEISLFFALGIRKKDIYKKQISEVLLSTLLTLFIGGLSGFWYSMVLATSLKNNIPFQLPTKYPNILVLAISLGFIGYTLLLRLITTKMISNMDLDKNLKEVINKNE
jgi:ABC-type antimicrobial peptide transport system permease subunit